MGSPTGVSDHHQRRIYTWYKVQPVVLVSRPVPGLGRPVLTRSRLTHQSHYPCVKPQGRHPDLSPKLLTTSLDLLPDPLPDETRRS